MPTGIGLGILRDIPAPKCSDQGVLYVQVIKKYLYVVNRNDEVTVLELFVTGRLCRNFHMDWFGLYTLYKLLLLNEYDISYFYQTTTFISF